MSRTPVDFFFWVWTHNGWSSRLVHDLDMVPADRDRRKYMSPVYEVVKGTPLFECELLQPAPKKPPNPDEFKAPPAPKE